MNKKDPRLEDVTIVRNDKGEAEVVKKKKELKEILAYGKTKKEFNKIQKKLKK